MSIAHAHGQVQPVERTDVDVAVAERGWRGALRFRVGERHLLAGSDTQDSHFAIAPGDDHPVVRHTRRAVHLCIRVELPFHFPAGGVQAIERVVVRAEEDDSRSRRAEEMILSPVLNFQSCLPVTRFTA